MQIDKVDPIDERKVAILKMEDTINFSEAAKQYIQANAPKWKNPKSQQQWTNTIVTYCEPIIGSIAVDKIDTQLVLSCIKPIWITKTETASRVRGRIEIILDFAKVMGFRDGENPAKWKGHLDQLLPAIDKIAPPRHHASMPYSDISAFVSKLQKDSTVASKALIFLILTASRTSEVIKANWDEIDFETRSWKIPANRMKSNKEHHVPLSSAAAQILKEIWTEGDHGFIFSHKHLRRPLSDMAMLNVLRRRKLPFTVHGFRATFRTWAAEKTNVQNDVAEAALAHSVGNKVVAAYQRGDLFEKRRTLMKTWAHFLQKR